MAIAVTAGLAFLIGCLLTYFLRDRIRGLASVGKSAENLAQLEKLRAERERRLRIVEAEDADPGSRADRFDRLFDRLRSRGR